MWGIDIDPSAAAVTAAIAVVLTATILYMWNLGTRRMFTFDDVRLAPVPRGAGAIAYFVTFDYFDGREMRLSIDQPLVRDAVNGRVGTLLTNDTFYTIKEVRVGDDPTAAVVVLGDAVAAVQTAQNAGIVGAINSTLIAIA